MVEQLCEEVAELLPQSIAKTASIQLEGQLLLRECLQN